MRDREAGSEPLEGVHILGLVAVLLRQWKTVVATMLLVVAVATAAFFLQPKRYAAKTVLFLAQDRTQGGGAGAMVAKQLGIPIPALSLGGSPNQKLIETILHKGRSVQDLIAERVKAQAGGGIEGEATVRRILDKGTDVESAPDGSIIVQVTAGDPRLAASIANEYPVAINATAARVTAASAVQKQRFLERQLAEARQRLDQSEDRLLQFQRRENAPAIKEQAEKTVEAAAALQQEIFRQEVRVGQLRRIATPDNPELQAAQGALSDLRGQLRRLTAEGGARGQVFVPLGGSAELRRDATRIMRDYTKDEQVYVSLLAAFSEAQIDANNNLPVVTVIDPALVPRSPAGAGLVFRLVFAAVLGLALGVLAAFLRDYLRSSRDHPQNAVFFAAWEEFRGGIYRPRNGRSRAPAAVGK
ncbi:MAG TPA: GNVR domain-containing protein [Longimicrobiaceae bacterium]|nr:GNVR domain-containing protein [Longimicrobiaceae bacterium]